MSIQAFIQRLEIEPETIEFSETMEVIETSYTFHPTAFRNADVLNNAEQNLGSCKIFAFGQLHQLSVEKTLACFGVHYREDVLLDPNGTSHSNIRNFMTTGWDGIEFLCDEPVLTPAV